MNNVTRMNVFLTAETITASSIWAGRAVIYRILKTRSKSTKSLDNTPENCELVVDMVEECSKNSSKGPDEEEDAQLPDLIGGIGKGTKVEETPIAQLARNPFEDGEDHVQGEVAGHGAKEDPPCEGLIPKAGSLLEGEEDATYRSPKSCCHPSSCATRHKISLFSVLPDMGGKCISLDQRMQ